MLKDHKIHTTLPAQDLERAKRFYGDTLGLGQGEDGPAGTYFEAGGTRFLVFPSLGKPSGEHTQMGWTVEDIESEVQRLKERGVRFEEYDLPDFKTEASVVTTGPVRAAWFKDSEGNLLGLVEFVTVGSKAGGAAGTKGDRNE